MENDLAKFDIEKAAKEIAARPLGSDFLILSKEEEKIIELSKIVSFDFDSKLKATKKTGYYVYDCRLNTLYGNQHNEIAHVKPDDNKSTLKEACRSIDNSNPCVLVILNFDLMHQDKILNSWNQRFIFSLKGNDLNEKSLLHKDSVIIAGYSGAGHISTSLGLIAFELINQ